MKTLPLLLSLLVLAYAGCAAASEGDGTADQASGTLSNSGTASSQPGYGARVAAMSSAQSSISGMEKAREDEARSEEIVEQAGGR